MRWLVLIWLAAIIALSEGRTRNSYEDIDLEKLVKDEPQWHAIFNCLMDRGPCFGDMQKFKDMLPIMVQTKCAQCTPKQKERLDLAVKLISTRYPRDFQEIMNKYSI